MEQSALESSPLVPRARRESSPRRRAATMVETLFALAIIAALVVVILPIVARARAASRSVGCLANLRQLSIAFTLYSQEEGRLPCPSLTEISWERSLSKYAAAESFRCSGDEELAPSTGSSYDWRDTGIDDTTLANYPLQSSARPDIVLVYDALPSWHQKDRMNVAFVNGSAQSITQEACVEDLKRPIRGPGAGGANGTASKKKTGGSAK